jgi:hypothetical protein
VNRVRTFYIAQIAIALLFLAAACAKKPIMLAGVDVGGDPTIARTAAIPEEDANDTSPKRVCVQWYVDEKDKPMIWEWRCITAERLREVLFPESAAGRKRY